MATCHTCGIKLLITTYTTIRERTYCGVCVINQEIDAYNGKSSIRHSLGLEDYYACYNCGKKIPLNCSFIANKAYCPCCESNQKKENSHD